MLPDVGTLFSSSLDVLIDGFEVEPLLVHDRGGSSQVKCDDSSAVDALRGLVEKCGGASSFSSDVRDFRLIVAHHK